MKNRYNSFYQLGVILMALWSIAAPLSSTNAFAGAEVNVVDHVDLNQYIGKWYEIASIPQSFQKQCVANTTAEYSFAERNLIRVLNSCDQSDGTRSTAEGRAKVEDVSTNAKLKVTFVKFIEWIFAFGGNYWILDVAPDYSYALVGDPTKKYAWILGRTSSLPNDVLARAGATFKKNGYDTCKILTSVQFGGFSERIPFCKVVEESESGRQW